MGVPKGGRKAWNMIINPISVLAARSARILTCTLRSAKRLSGHVTETVSIAKILMRLVYPSNPRRPMNKAIVIVIILAFVEVIGDIIAFKILRRRDVEKHRLPTEWKWR
jgi:hypothetical protein